MAQKAEIRAYRQLNPNLTQQQICQWFETKYGIPIKQTTMSDILSTKASYADEATNQPEAKKQRKQLYPDLENALFQWHQRFQYRAPISGEVLQTKAKELWSILPQYQGQETPALSGGWLDGFKKRYAIKEHVRHGEASSVAVDGERLLELQEILKGYHSSAIFNCDETALFWKMTPNKTLTTEASAGVKQDKKRVSLHFTVNADGTRKLYPWVIGKAQRPRCFKAAGVNIERMSMKYVANKKGWMKTQIFQEYLRWFDAQMNQKVLLLMDNFSAHETAVNLSKAELKWTTVIFLQPNTTSMIQPLDQGIIRSFKAHYRRHWVTYMLQELESQSEPTKTVNILKAIRFVIRAWHDVSPTTIKNCSVKSSLLGPLFGPPTIRQFRTSQSQSPSSDAGAEAEAALKENMRQLEQQHRIRLDMDINAFIDPEDPIEDTEGDFLQQIVDDFTSAPVHESEEEGVEELPKITEQQALACIQQLALFDEQQAENESNHNDLLRGLHAWGREIRGRREKRARQSTLDLFLA